MIVKAKDAKSKSFRGVNFEVLAVSDKTMITVMKYAEGNRVGMHKHPNEQGGYVVSGKFKVWIGNEEDILEAGDSYIVPENTEHAFEVIEPGDIIDVFVPPREDYR